MVEEAKAPRNFTVPPIGTSGNLEVSSIEDGETIDDASIHPRGDQDVFSFEVSEDDANRLATITGRMNAVPRIEPDVSVYGPPDTHRLTCNSGSGSERNCHFEPGDARAGEYFIVTADEGNDSTGAYELMLELTCRSEEGLRLCSVP